MADADCEMCEVMGYRTCDVCGGVVFIKMFNQLDLCYECRINAAGSSGATIRPAGSL